MIIMNGLIPSVCNMYRGARTAKKDQNIPRNLSINFADLVSWDVMAKKQRQESDPKFNAVLLIIATAQILRQIIL